LLSKIYEVLKNNPGKNATYLVLPGQDNIARRIPVPFGVSRNFELEDSLSTLGCHIID